MPTDPVRMTNCSLFTHIIHCIFQVLHPNVEEDIDSDLELLRTVAYYLDKYEAVTRISQTLTMLHFQRCVHDEMRCPTEFAD